MPKANIKVKITISLNRRDPEVKHWTFDFALRHIWILKTLFCMWLTHFSGHLCTKKLWILIDFLVMSNIFASVETNNLRTMKEMKNQAFLFISYLELKASFKFIQVLATTTTSYFFFPQCYHTRPVIKSESWVRCHAYSRCLRMWFSRYPLLQRDLLHIWIAAGCWLQPIQQQLRQRSN